jgi:hypothetical protein
MFLAIIAIVAAVIAVVGLAFYNMSAAVAGGIVIVGILLGLGVDQLRARGKI